MEGCRWVGPVVEPLDATARVEFLAASLPEDEWEDSEEVSEYDSSDSPSETSCTGGGGVVGLRWDLLPVFFVTETTGSGARGSRREDLWGRSPPPPAGERARGSGAVTAADGVAGGA